MAKHARTMVEKNGFTDVIQVIQDSAESLILPEKVCVHVLIQLRCLSSQLFFFLSLPTKSVLPPLDFTLCWGLVTLNQPRVAGIVTYKIGSIP